MINGAAASDGGLFLKINRKNIAIFFLLWYNHKRKIKKSAKSCCLFLWGRAIAVFKSLSLKTDYNGGK